MERNPHPAIMLIGQAPPQRETAEPYGRTRLYLWLSKIGITKLAAQRLFTFAALVAEFPGKHRGGDLKPTRLQMERYRPHLLALLEQTRPSIVVPIGVLAIREVLKNEKLSLNETVGKRFDAVPFGVDGEKTRIVPLPTPQA